MLISLRSQLIAGSAAVLTTGAVAVAPVAQQLPALSMTSVAPVALAAFNNPIEQLLATLEMGQDYLFGTYYNGADAPTPGAGEANWWFAGLDQTGGDVLNYLLANDVSLGYYSSVGLLPQITNDAQPIIRQLGTNLYNYINAGLSGVLGSIAALSNGVWDFPAAAVEAAQLALSGEFGEAFTVLTDAVITPLTTAGVALFDAASYVVTDFIAKTVAVLEVIPENLALFVGAAAGGAAVLAEKTVAIATQWITALGSGDWEGAWNTAIDGLLGPSGLPGTVLNLTTGAGVQTGPILDPQTDIVDNFVPSLRTATQATIWNTQNALTATAPPPAAAITPVAPRAAAAVADAEPADAEPAEVAPSEAAPVAAPVTAAKTADSAQTNRAKSHRAAKRAAKAAG